MMFVETEMRQIRARLAAVVLMTEDGETTVTKDLIEDLQRIQDYVSRIAVALHRPAGQNQNHAV